MKIDCCEWKLTTIYPQERKTWRSGVRSAMHATSQPPRAGVGRDSNDVDDAHHMHVNQKPDDAWVKVRNFQNPDL